MMPPVNWAEFGEHTEVSASYCGNISVLSHVPTAANTVKAPPITDRDVRRTDATIAVLDHNIPTDWSQEIPEDSQLQIDTLRQNCSEFGVELYEVDDARNGIVHVIGPEQGFTLPGTTIVCGDSHTATHGAFGALAFGVGTSEVEHVLATQTLIQAPAKSMCVTVNGSLPVGCTAKDLILALIGKIGTGGGTGHVIEYAGPAIEALSMEGRMTVSNMTIEGGARAGLVAPDETTFAYLKGRPKAPGLGASPSSVRGEDDPSRHPEYRGGPVHRAPVPKSFF